MGSLWQPDGVEIARFVRRTAAVGVVGGMAGLGYAAGYEVRAFTLREVTVPVLPPGRRSLRVLHLSDLHMTPGQGKKQRWLRSLAALEPDLVVNTGDNMAHPAVVPALVESLGPLLDLPGVFVFGSNDYFAPSPRNPVRYLLPDDGRRHTNNPRLPHGELAAIFGDRGWRYLGNRRDRLTVSDVDIAFAGVDDPHLEYDDLGSIAGSAPADADLRIGVAHAPYVRVLDQFADDGYGLIMAGHTHGGQLCLPFVGALVTNCDLEPGRAKGLHRHPALSSPGDPRSSWMHVSAGAGTSPYVPLRFCCRPEATLLTLTSAPASGPDSWDEQVLR
jgi:predicted MPP superfamily phosphohydrolase